jgi:predicted CoA-substrate-specific enzyme activase
VEALYLGIDVGSVSTNAALLSAEGAVVHTAYLRTHGRPIDAIQQVLRGLAGEVARAGAGVAGVGCTGSARQLAAVLVGADVVKNEITAHAVAAMHLVPGVRTVFEIGGQDSKLILLRNGVVVDFAMNTVCAAGTGSFLDQQAFRLGIPIEEFGAYAARSRRPSRIAGRCTVFAESDMIHNQQLGHPPEDIIAGLCEALARNFLSNLARGKELLPPIVFQGGVAANQGIRRAFERALGLELMVPEHHAVMGAIGAALLARDCQGRNGGRTRFRGFAAAELDCAASGAECGDCANVCEIVQLESDGEVIARWGDKCGRYQS